MRIKSVLLTGAILFVSLVSINPLFGNNIGWSINPEKIPSSNDYTIYIWPKEYDRTQYYQKGLFYPPKPEKKHITLAAWLKYMAAEKNFVYAMPLKANRIRYNDYCKDKAGGVFWSPRTINHKYDSVFVKPYGENKRRLHMANDFKSSPGENVYATLTGEVVSVWNVVGTLQGITLKADNGVISKILYVIPDSEIHNNTPVIAGKTKLGVVDDTMKTYTGTPNHLHVSFEHKDRGRFDPYHEQEASFELYKKNIEKYDCNDTIVDVRNSGDLINAVNDANNYGNIRIIRLEDGTYEISTAIIINAHDLSLIGKSKKADSVFIKERNGSNLNQLINVKKSDFCMFDLTLGSCSGTLLRVKEDAANTTIRRVIFKNAGYELIRIVNSYHGIIEGCNFLLTSGYNAKDHFKGVYISGSNDWILLRNRFEDIYDTNSLYKYDAIRINKDSENNYIQNNSFKNCDNCVVVGDEDLAKKSSGSIRNNIIYNNIMSENYNTAQILLIGNQDTSIYNNTIFLENAQKTAIKYHGNSNDVKIKNNLIRGEIDVGDNFSGENIKNHTNASKSYFIDTSSENFHILEHIDSVIDKGENIASIIIDFEGDTRPQGDGIDIGADEFNSGSKPPEWPSPVR